MGKQKMYLTLEQAAMSYGICKKQLLNLYYTDRDHGRCDRFIVENGIVKVHEEYLCPHRSDIEALFYQALESTSGEEKPIARVIAKRTGKDVNTVYFYLRNFKFKNHIFAHTVMNILKEFIQSHNLFYARGIA